MSDYSNIPLGLKITTQIPLDVKSYAANEAALKDLGSGNNLAFTYCKGAIFYCVEEGTRYQWREVVGSEVGLMSSHYTYPANVVAFGITYSNKIYNFFPILITGQLNSDWNSESGVTKILNKPTIPSITGLATTTYVDAQDALKVDKVTGSRLITSAESVVLGNTSGTNTGNNAVNTLYSGLEASKQDKLTLTSNNTSGAATLIGGVLNIPEYSNSQNLQAVTSSGNTTNIPIRFINSESTVLKAVLGDNTKGLFIEMDNSATGIDILNNDAVGTIPFIYRSYDPDAETYTTFTELDNDGNLSSNSFIKIGGTSTQYLMADGTTSTSASALVFLDEGNGIGIAKASRDPLHFGNIGEEAFDISIWDSDMPDTGDYGATGYGSFAAGYGVKSKEYTSSSFGYAIDNAGIGSFDTGFNLKDVGYTNFVTGMGHDVTSANSTVVGQASNIIVSGIDDYNAYPTKPLFVVGNGTIQNADPDFNVLTRSDAFIVRMNGLATLPSVTNTLITADTTGKALVTKEYISNIVKPYKVYTALLTQIGTSAPTATVLENTLGGTLVWSYSTTGVYGVTLSNAFTANKTIIFSSNPKDNLNFVRMTVNPPNFVLIYTYYNNVASENVLDNWPIEIRVYN